MKVWEIPEEHLSLLAEFDARRKRLEVDGINAVESLTGIRPIGLTLNGALRFVPPPDTELPPWFTRPDEPYGFVMPRKNYKKGRELLEKWKRLNFASATLFDLFRLLKINFEGTFSYQRDKIADHVYLIQAKGWNPEDYGYRELNI